MISDKTFQNMSLALVFAIVLHLASLTSAERDPKYQIKEQNQLNRNKRSADDYYDSLMSELYQPILKENLFRTAAKRAAAMGVDLPDYILHYKGNNLPNLVSFREKMQKSGK